MIGFMMAQVHAPRSCDVIRIDFDIALNAHASGELGRYAARDQVEPFDETHSYILRTRGYNCGTIKTQSWYDAGSG